MLATPHRKDVTELSSVQHIRDLTAKLQRRIHDENILLTLTLGMENHIDDALPEDAAAGKALTMNGSRYILVEMPFFGSIAEHDFVEDALLGIQSQGLTPVFAHPERIEAFQQQPELLERYINMGMLSQLTRGSSARTLGRRNTAILARFAAAGHGAHHFFRHPLTAPTAHARTRRSPENRNRNRRLPESKGNGQRHAPRHPRRHEAYSPFPLNEGRLGWG